jgi:hypothetical protein
MDSTVGVADARPALGRPGGLRAVTAARRGVLVPLAIFLATRVIDGLMIAWFAREQVSSSIGGWFVVRPTPASPGYLTALTNFDGQWYQQIAEHGYPTSLPMDGGQVAQNAWAFYPLYPGLVRGLMTVSGLSFAAAATLVSMACGAVAVCLVYRLLLRTGSRFSATATVLALCTYAAAPVLQAAYTESLALLEIAVVVWGLQGRRYGVVAAAAVALSLTRPIVLPLALLIAVHGVVRWRRQPDEFPARERRACAGAAVLATASFAVWPVVAAVVTGRADAYLATQRSWVIRASEGGYESWLTHVAGHGGFSAGIVGAVALTVLAWLLLTRRAAAWGTEWRAWCGSYALFLFLTTRPIASVFRMALLAVVPWWPAPTPADEPSPPRRGQLLVLAAVAAFGLATQWLWIQWFFIPRVGSFGAP